MDDSHLRETRIDGDVAYDGHFLKVSRDRVRLPNGAETGREFIRHPGAVVILALFDDGRVLLERQYRYPNDRVFIELPAGSESSPASILPAAKRELEEETGYTASRWDFVCTIHNAVAYSDEHLDLFLARGLTAGQAKLDDGEFLDVFTATIPEMLEQVRSGEISDVKTIIGAFWLEKIAAGTWTPG
jgi:ADP-ribose pyrophosphatase